MPCDVHLPDKLESSVIRSSRQFVLIMVILGSIVFAPKLANAEGAGRRDISGRVIDAETREALPYAGVRLLGTRIGTITAVTGHFVLVNVTSAACTLEVSMIGYEPTHIDVVAGSDVSALEFVLEPAVIEEDAFYVYADHYSTWKKSTEVGQMTLSPSNLSDLPGFGEVDLFRSLQLLPGISAVGDGSAGLFVRGGYSGPKPCAIRRHDNLSCGPLLRHVQRFQCRRGERCPDVRWRLPRSLWWQDVECR